jgi:CBS domain-containing protein
MLANSFSYLPILHDGIWKIVSDVDIIRYLRSASSFTTRKEIDAEKQRPLSAKISDAISKGVLDPVPAKCCSLADTIPFVLGQMETRPVLVIEDIGGEKRLVGIVTPFDLL